MNSPCLLFFLFVSALICGCGGASPSRYADEPIDARKAAGGKNPPAPGQPDFDRKIIYDGRVEVVVDEIDPITDRVRDLVKRHEGYLASSEVSGTGGSRRTAEFTVRVPVAGYEQLRDEFAKLGNTTRNASKSEDVTEEFMDLEARVKILKQEEEALKELLKKDAGRLDELLKVREQLTKNREQIEKTEGRVKYLTSKVSYSTIYLTLRETKDYIPPTNPSFGGQIGSAFSNSVDALYTFGKNIVLFVVTVAPWSPLILLGLWLLRRAYRWAMSPARKAA